MPSAVVADRGRGVLPSTGMCPGACSLKAIQALSLSHKPTIYTLLYAQSGTLGTISQVPQPVSLLLGSAGGRYQMGIRRGKRGKGSSFFPMPAAAASWLQILLHRPYPAISTILPPHWDVPPLQVLVPIRVPLLRGFQHHPQGISSSEVLVTSPLPFVPSGRHLLPTLNFWDTSGHLSALSAFPILQERIPHIKPPWFAIPSVAYVSKLDPESYCLLSQTLHSMKARIEPLHPLTTAQYILVYNKDSYK